MHSWVHFSFYYKTQTAILQVKWALLMIERLNPAAASSAVLSEWNWENNWPRRSRLSSRMPQRSTPTTHLPTASLTSSRRTSPELYFLFFSSIVTHLFFSRSSHTVQLSLYQHVSVHRQGILCMFCSPSQGKIFCILLRRKWKRILFDQIKCLYKITYTNGHFSGSFCFIGSVSLFMWCSLIGQKHARGRL